jgi:hypothetical protein
MITRRTEEGAEKCALRDFRRAELTAGCESKAGENAERQTTGLAERQERVPGAAAKIFL